MCHAVGTDDAAGRVGLDTSTLRGERGLERRHCGQLGGWRQSGFLKQCSRGRPPSPGWAAVRLSCAGPELELELESEPGTETRGGQNGSGLPRSLGRPKNGVLIVSSLSPAPAPRPPSSSSPILLFYFVSASPSAAEAYRLGCFLDFILPSSPIRNIHRHNRNHG